MNPLTLFDYVYYRLAYLYENTFMQMITKELKAITLLSMFQFLNGFTILVFFIPPKEFIREIFIAIGFLIILLNFLRYKKYITYSELAEKWDNEPKEIKRTKKNYILFYMVLSITMFVIMVIS